MPDPTSVGRYPVIVIPGITATSLVDDYPIGGEEIWSAVLNKDFQRLTLHPDDLRYEAQGPALVQTGRLFELTYKDLILALRHELSPSADQPTPVFSFSYDWRHDVRETAKVLDRFIEEVIARTRLLRHYASWYPGEPRVHVVAHSMGGIVMCEYLSQFAQKKRIARVCTLCTPFQGSIEAVCKLLTGIGYLSGEQPKERERESARTFQAVYQLLPSFKGAAIRLANGADVDLYRPSEWQASIIESMSEFVRLHSVIGNSDIQAGGNNRVAAQILDDMLDGARQVRDNVSNLGQALFAAGLSPNDWLAVVGVGAKTRLRIDVGEKNGSPWFSIDDHAFVDEWSDDHDNGNTGDSTVPLSGAIAPFLPRESHVAVTPDDFGTFELADRVLLNLAGFHAQVPNLNLAQRLVVKHLLPSFTGPVWGRPLPGVAQWNPPIPQLTRRS